MLTSGIRLWQLTIALFSSKSTSEASVGLGGYDVIVIVGAWSIGRRCVDIIGRNVTLAVPINSSGAVH